MTILKTYGKITAALFLLAASINLFLGPHHVAAGGVSGIGILLESALGWDRAAVIMVLNILMLILAYAFLGKGPFLKVLYGSFAFPVAIALVPEYMVAEDRIAFRDIWQCDFCFRCSDFVQKSIFQRRHNDSTADFQEIL